MNRQIIFRGKRLTDGEWKFGDLENLIPPNMSTRVIVSPENGCKRCNDCDANTIGQYTGVDDKNGKRIYEGDIVRIHEDIGYDNIGVVVFKNGCFGVEYDSYKPKCFHPLFKTKDEWKDMNATIPIKITFEVLGNIFDDSLILAN